MKRNIETGQTVCVKPIGNAARYSKELIDGVVTKIGRKYFEVEFNGNNVKIEIETLFHFNGDYSPDYQVYLKRTDIEDEKEFSRLTEEIKKKLYEVSLDKLKKVIQLLESE